MTSDLDDILLRWGAVTPHDVDAGGRVGVLAAHDFAYVGRALTIPEFAAYVETYDFGAIPPDYIVLHHTAVPTVAQWTERESGLDQDQIKTKRLRQLAGIRDYYQHRLGWDAGPHLFVDDAWVYLFTPMDTVGIHAAQGNSTTVNGRLHYSIGIEVVGDYTKRAWSDATAQNVAQAVALLHQRLGTFALVDGPGPGKVGAHRMYNKPSCPGAKITADYYLPLIRHARAALDAPRPTETRRAGHYGAMVREDYRATGAACAYLPPGSELVLDTFAQGGYRHLASGLGFVAEGDVI